MITVERLDHLVLTVADIDATCSFYARVLNMTVIVFGDDRKGLQFGNQKINLHQCGSEIEPKAAHPTAGSADLCLITSTPMQIVMSHLHREGVPILEGPVQRTGAVGIMTSLYFRDPDGNLLELSAYGITN